MANTAFSPTCNKFLRIDKIYLSTKRGKILLIFANIIFLLSVFIITLCISDTFYAFFHEYFFGYFHNFNNWQLFKDNVFAQSAYFDYETIQHHLNVAGDYQVLTMSVIVMFFFEALFLFANMVLMKRKWEKYQLSYGVYENKEFHKLHHKTYRMITNTSMYIVNITLLIFLAIVAVLGGLVAHNDFQAMFHLVLIIVLFLMCLFFGVYNLKVYNDLQAKYKTNFDKINWKHNNKVGLSVLATFGMNLLMGFASVYICIYALPLDVFFIYLLIRYIPLIYRPKEKFSYR